MNAAPATTTPNPNPVLAQPRPSQASSATGNTTITASNTTTGSLSDSLASIDGSRTPNVEHLSRTNLYIRGLQSVTRDHDLSAMCSRFGQILSTKAILDKTTGCCRGYGFVEFTSAQAAELAVKELTKSGVQAQMAKISSIHSSHTHQHHHHHHNNNNNYSNGSHNNIHNSHQHNQNTNNNNADPTNLYIANLPTNMGEQELENLLSSYGPVVSTRILRDQSNIPRGVGFARMESRDKCEQIIEQLNGRPCKDSKEPLLVKFADGGNKKRHHHNNHAHQHHNNNHHPHHKVHQDESRWRDSNSNAVESGGLSNYDHQSNISNSNQISDLTMMSTLGYSRMQPGFSPAMAAGAAYPIPLVPGQPYAIPPQMIQAGSLGPSNQAALHYGHIPQLTSQMQSLQIAHPGPPVGGYLPPQHQWPLWAHHIPQQPPQPHMPLANPIHSHTPQQQPSPNSTAIQQQPPVIEDKIRVSLPM